MLRAAALVLVCALAWGAPAGAQPSRPNVVLILADDLGWNDVGYHGSEIRTPHIDALAGRGVVLDRFYGHLTGGIGYWDKVHRGGYDWMRDEEVLREDGYTTDLMTDEAIRLLRGRDRTSPVFLYASFNAPHVPNEAPAEAVARYAHIQDEHRRTHAAMVSLLDAAIGRLLAALDDEGMTRDTLVLFLSDNGGATRDIVRPWVRWVIPHFDEYASSNAPLRGGKSDVFEGALRVPAVFWWPGRLEGGRTIAGRVTAQDVLPTLAEALSLPLDGNVELEGTSRWDVIAEGADTPAPDFVAGNMDSFAYFRGPWKLVEATSPLPFAKVSGTFLFRVDEDPSEVHDLAAAHPDVVAELQEALAAFPVGASDFQLPRPWEMGTLFGGAETRPPWAETAERE